MNKDEILKFLGSEQSNSFIALRLSEWLIAVFSHYASLKYVIVGLTLITLTEAWLHYNDSVQKKKEEYGELKDKLRAEFDMEGEQ